MFPSGSATAGSTAAGFGTSALCCIRQITAALRDIAVKKGRLLGSDDAGPRKTRGLATLDEGALSMDQLLATRPYADGTRHDPGLPGTSPLTNSHASIGDVATAIAKLSKPLTRASCRRRGERPAIAQRSMIPNLVNTVIQSLP